MGRTEIDDQRRRLGQGALRAALENIPAGPPGPLDNDSNEVLKLIVGRCTELENGERMIDAILTNSVLPNVSREFLTRMMEGKPIERVSMTVSDGDFGYAFE